MAAFAGGAAPGFELYVRRRADLSQRIETLRDHIEDAGVVEIIPQGIVESLQQFSILARPGVDALKSGTAMRTFSTPSPVPVLIQSCAHETDGAKTEVRREEKSQE